MAKEEVGRKFPTFGNIRLMQSKGENERKERDEKMRENEKMRKEQTNRK